MSSERLCKIFQGAIMAQKKSRTSDLNKGYYDRCGNMHACLWPLSLTTSRQEQQQQLRSNFLEDLKMTGLLSPPPPTFTLPHQLRVLIWCYFQSWNFGESTTAYPHKIPMSLRTIKPWSSVISMQFGARNLDEMCLYLVAVWPWASRTTPLSLNILIHKMAIIQTTLMT